jgi:phage shock protein A
MLDDQRDAAFNSLQEQVNRIQNQIHTLETRILQLEAKHEGPLAALKLPGSQHSHE